MESLAQKYVESHDLCEGQIGNLLRAGRSMEKFGIIPDTVDSLQLNRWVRSLPYASTTKQSYRKAAYTLVRWGGTHGLCKKLDEPPIPVKANFPPVVAWTMEELQRLLVTASNLKGRINRNGCPLAAFWRAWILVGYETGVRFSDIHNLRCDQLHDSRLYIVHHKTGQPAGKILSPACVKALEKMRDLGDGKTFFRWALARRHVFLQFKKLARKANVQGSLKWLRRTGATQCELANPGTAPRFLGHLSGPGLAMRHYLDQSQLADHSPRPPQIIEDTG